VSGARFVQGARATHTGGCHCGAVRFEVTTTLEDVLDCNCSVCTRKGFLHLIVAPEDFRLVEGEDALAEYRFGTRTARHLFCRTCGVHPCYIPRSHPDKIDVNVRALDDVDVSALRTRPFDGRNWEANVGTIR